MTKDINSIHENKPSYNEIQDSLHTLKIHHSTAELYGLLCSLFSASAQLTEQAWINGLLNQEPEDNQETKNAKDILIKLDFHVGRSVNCVKSYNPAYGYNKEVACNLRNS